ncbi:hypothetical protein AB4Y43_01370 [Paraburkholderia sp. BR10872]|uniref:hypothetical protein n=1 Tax=Paraburkholderia sp. BR10872 TaxID=3236989 RepID=UPI0034D1F411
MTVNVTDYTTFIQQTMGIPTSALPTNSPFILQTLALAQEIVNPALQNISLPGGSNLGYTGPGIYELAVYNLGGDMLINFAADQPGQVFFQNARASYGINSFKAGVIGSSADATTSESMVVPEAMKNLTLQNLQNLKTPYGRQYLYFAQAFGTLWGLS